MKFILIPFIALGFILYLTFGIEYNCKGMEMFPIYYGSPFIFMKTSLGSSMEYYYSISGLLLNVIAWSLLIFIIHFAINKFIKATSNNKYIKATYKMIIGSCLIFSLLIISITFTVVGRGFNKNLNYWYWNFDKEAKDWGMECKGHWKFFIL